MSRQPSIISARASVAAKNSIELELPFHVSSLVRFIEKESLETQTSEFGCEEEAKCMDPNNRIVGIYQKLMLIDDAFNADCSPLVLFDVFDKFKLHTNLLALLREELTMPVYNLVLKVLCVHYLSNKELRNALMKSEFLDFLAHALAEVPHPTSVPFLLYGLFNLIQNVESFRQQFLEIGGHSYIYGLRKIALDAFANQRTDQETEEEDHETKPFLMNAFDTEILTDDDVYCVNTSSAQILDSIMSLFSHDVVKQTFGFAKEMFELKYDYITSMMFHGLRISLLRFPGTQKELTDFGFDLEALSKLNSKTKIAPNLFVDSFLFISALCIGSPYMCEQYLTKQLFDNMTIGFDTTTDHLDVLLYNLEILVQQTPLATANFVSSSLFDSVASMFSQEFFLIRIGSLMVLNAILKCSDDESTLFAVLETGVLDAYQIMNNVDDGPTQREFLLALRHLLDYSRINDRQDLLQSIVERTWLEDILNEYVDSEYDDVGIIASNILEELIAISNE